MSHHRNTNRAPLREIVGTRPLPGVLLDILSCGHETPAAHGREHPAAKRRRCPECTPTRRPVMIRHKHTCSRTKPFHTPCRCRCGAERVMKDAKFATVPRTGGRWRKPKKK